jgi:transcriptional regulator with XRE-family HTH domain
LAAHANIGKNHISELERGAREIGLRNLEAIAKALETTPDALLRGLSD